MENFRSDKFASAEHKKGGRLIATGKEMLSTDIQKRKWECAMRRNQNYAVKMPISLASLAMATAAAAGPLALTEHQLDTVTAGQAETTVSTLSQASGIFVATTTGSTSATVIPGPDGPDSIGQQGIGIAIAVGSGSRNAQVSTTASSPVSPSVGFEFARTVNIGPAQIAVGFTQRISGAWLTPYVAVFP